MSEYIIETHNLTKRYGNQVSVSKFEYSCKARQDLWPAGTQRCGQDHHHENVVGINSPYLRQKLKFSDDLCRVTKTKFFLVLDV